MKGRAGLDPGNCDKCAKSKCWYGVTGCFKGQAFNFGLCKACYQKISKSGDFGRWADRLAEKVLKKNS